MALGYLCYEPMGRLFVDYDDLGNLLSECQNEMSFFEFFISPRTAPSSRRLWVEFKRLRADDLFVTKTPISNGRFVGFWLCGRREAYWLR